MSDDEELSIEQREQRLREAWEAKQGMPEADRLASLSQEREQITASLRDEQITNAFLTHDAIKWHDRGLSNDQNLWMALGEVT